MCGMTRKEDIAYAAQIGVNAVGFLFYEKSRRAVSIEKAMSLLTTFPLFLNAVAVFVNPQEELVRKIIGLPFQYLQFHGQETAIFCEQFNKPYIKAIAAISSEYIAEVMQEHKNAQAFLLDTPSVQHGGTGKTFNWDLIPEHSDKPIILAGGLTSENVGAAIKYPAIYAIDVCSGVESNPGEKNPAKMLQFIEEVRRNT
ncbi:phosphoribosylanthranilate isomerase [Legionella adelaidensis]|nr:phosphoribosylanthranilate isomerase [Legionella adelaidensis]